MIKTGVRGARKRRVKAWKDIKRFNKKIKEMLHIANAPSCKTESLAELAYLYNFFHQYKSHD